MEVRLLNIEDKAFKVLTFGMINVDRMVGRLVQLVQNADVPAALCRCREDGQAELIFIDGL